MQVKNSAAYYALLKIHQPGVSEGIEKSRRKKKEKSRREMPGSRKPTRAEGSGQRGVQEPLSSLAYAKS